jgi:hypothetical protein
MRDITCKKLLNIGISKNERLYDVQAVEKSGISAF